MGLADDLKQIPEPHPVVRCGVYCLRETLAETDPEGLKVFNDTLNAVVALPGDKRKNGQSGLTIKWLATVLQENGHNISKSTLQRHSKGWCTCGVV